MLGEYEQVRTSACETVYDVEGPGGEVYRLRLWIIVGGTPALAFEGGGATTRRYPRVAEWDFGSGLTMVDYDARTQGPTFDVLPDGVGTVIEYLAWALPRRAERLAEAEAQRAEATLIRKIGMTRDRWVERVAEDRPRRVPNSLRRPDGRFVSEGRDISKALIRAVGLNRGAVKIGNVIVGVTGLRRYAKAVSRDRLLIEVQEDCIVVVHSEGRGKSTIKHGAWDRYRGANGYTCELVFGRSIAVQVAAFFRHLSRTIEEQ